LSHLNGSRSSQESQEWCIHFAALKAVGESVKLPLKYYKNNLTGTLNLLELMSEFKCKTIVFSSSATVYGTSKSPLSESSSTGVGVTNPYGQTKHMMEQVLRDLQKSDPAFKVVLLRYFNPVGAHPSGRIGEDPKGIPNNLMPYVQQVAVGRRPFLGVFGDDYDTVDGTGVRDYIHVVDLAKGHMCALGWASAQPSGCCEVFNLGTGSGSSVLQVVKSMEKACGHTVPYKISPRRAGDLATVYADPVKAKKVLKWEAKRTMDVMCADCWKWQSSNPMGFGGSMPCTENWLAAVRVAMSPKAMAGIADDVPFLQKAKGDESIYPARLALLKVCVASIPALNGLPKAIAGDTPWQAILKNNTATALDPYARGPIVALVDLCLGMELAGKAEPSERLATLETVAKSDAAGVAAFSKWFEARY